MKVLNIFPSTLYCDAGVQHHQPHLSKIHFYFRSKIFPFFDFTDIHRVCFDIAVIFEYGGSSFSEEGNIVVDKSEMHAMFSAYLSNGKTNTTGGAGDQCSVPGFENWVNGHIRDHVLFRHRHGAEK